MGNAILFVHFQIGGGCAFRPDSQFLHQFQRLVCAIKKEH